MINELKIEEVRDIEDVMEDLFARNRRCVAEVNRLIQRTELPGLEIDEDDDETILLKDRYDDETIPGGQWSDWVQFADAVIAAERGTFFKGPDQPLPQIMYFFEYDHLPPRLQEVSRPIAEVAHRLNAVLPDSAEKAVALRKLLESKDAAVRAAL